MPQQVTATAGVQVALPVSNNDLRWLVEVSAGRIDGTVNRHRCRPGWRHCGRAATGSFRMQPASERKPLCPESDRRLQRFGVGVALRGGVASAQPFHPREKQPGPIGRGTELSTDPRNNRLLAGLPDADFKHIEASLAVAPFSQGTVLAEARETIDQVYFPLNGMISVLTVLNDGKAIEIATIGRDGVFGGAAAFGVYRTRVRGIVQIPIVAATLSATHLKQAADSSPAIHRLCLRYNEVLLTQACVTAACNALHVTEARFCRWLLQASQVSGSQRINLTHEFLSEMLGVRRSSITEIAGKLQSSGLISYSRGVIDILDPQALRARACECFETLLQEGAI